MRTEIQRKSIPHIKDTDFDDLTFGSARPSLVFFGSKRCKICRELFPIIEAAAFELRDKLDVYAVDVDKFRDLFRGMRLRGIPHLVFFRDGEVRERIGGFHPQNALVAKLEQLLD